MSKNASNTVNQNQVSNNTIFVTSYETPEVFIKIEHLHIYASKRRFELLLSMSPDGEKWSDQRHITGGITDELRRFVSKAYEQSVQVEADNDEGFEWVKTGNYLTGCQMYLQVARLSSSMVLVYLHPCYSSTHMIDCVYFCYRFLNRLSWNYHHLGCSFRLILYAHFLSFLCSISV